MYFHYVSKTDSEILEARIGPKASKDQFLKHYSCRVKGKVFLYSQGNAVSPASFLHLLL